MEVAGLEVLNGQNSSTAKSTSNFHTMLLYMGKEDYDMLAAEMKDVFDQINCIEHEGSVWSDLSLFTCC